MAKATRGTPLHGVRVLEVTKVWAGPEAGKQLAYLGAEVIKVESMGSLDVTRFYGVDDINNAPGFQSVNPQKKSVQIDMKSPAGLALLKDLAATCDIVVENLRPGAIDRLGIGYAALRAVKPDIIFVSMGMWGNDGPLAYQTGYAPCFVALGGISGLVGFAGEPPVGMNQRYSDSSFGTAAAYAALVALLHRRRTGRGQLVDVSAVEAASMMIGDALMDYALNGRVAACDGNRHAEMAPHGLYPCADGDWIAIAVRGEETWAALAAIADLGGDACFASFADRKANEDALDAAIGAWTKDEDAATLAERLQAVGIPATKSATSIDLTADDQLWARGFYPLVTDVGGNIKPTVGPGWKLGAPTDIGIGAPHIGEHNAYVFGEILGLSEAEQARLAEAGAIR